MRKKYTETDEIEIRLTHNVADHYFLEWRYKEPRKFLFFSIKDKWKLMSYYNPGVSSVEDDPNDDMYWYWHGFHMGKRNEVYLTIKGMIYLLANTTLYLSDS